jgi:hypothetical protein
MASGNEDQDQDTGTSTESVDRRNFYDDDAGKSVTASHLSYAKRGEAYDAGQAALAEAWAKKNPPVG